MSIAIVTGSAGLIGAEASKRFAREGLEIVGVDNNLRAYFFGNEASTLESRLQLEKSVSGYRHCALDIRDRDAVLNLFKEFRKEVAVVIHTAAQPSHDWAAREPFTDFDINANGTLNLLEGMRLCSPDSAFIFTSTNKVYGDNPNFLPLIEQETRWEIDPSHPFAEKGINETMSIDQTKHSLFGSSKVAADILVQEYGRYFQLKTATFRGGCLTGPGHAGAELHGFLSYLMKCTVSGKPYRVFGYKGKQVRDNIHSSDLVETFWHYFRKPIAGAVYNIGGGRHSNCSMLEAIDLCQEISGKTLSWSYLKDSRIGDQIWYISDVSRFKKDYPEWGYRYTLRQTLEEIHDAIV
jgi:CDP-paratose 2-epimerase